MFKLNSKSFNRLLLVHNILNIDMVQLIIYIIRNFELIEII